jgi:hypothetical protein
MEGMRPHSRNYRELEQTHRQVADMLENDTGNGDGGRDGSRERTRGE